MPSLRDQSIPGGWSDREVTVGQFLFRLLTPLNPDAVLEELESPEAATLPHFADPYWAKLWPAAPLLAECLIRNPLPKRTTALELGCGSGLVGITALACGLRVTFSDYVPLAVDLARENAARNGYERSEGLVLDWHRRESDSHSRFPLILAADVTYDRTNLEALLCVVEDRLEPGGQAWFGDAGRSPAPDFVELARNRGFAVTCYDQQDQRTDEFVFGQFRRFVLQQRG